MADKGNDQNPNLASFWMSLENEIHSSPNKAAETFCESKKNPKLSYTRDFLLSLRELDVCKTLPSRFDPSLLSEFEDASYCIQDRQRIPGSLPLQSYRRTEYSSSPPSKGDSSNYSRGIYGKWDNHSSGRSERDSDSKADWDTESGRHHGNQPRRSWQNSEHDGLLGSGSLPKPSGYAAGLLASKDRSNDIQLNRSNEPYHPPRPYKAVPQFRRSATDSYNDETFGSSECTSQDKAEEERKRRESFELMRKEQQKVLQEKQKLNPGHVSDFTELLEDTKDGKRVFNRSNELDESNSKSSSQTPGSRPLVPPGFRSTLLEKNSSARSVTHSHSAEVVATEIEQGLSHAKAVVQNGTLANQEERKSAQKMGVREQQHENTSIYTPSLSKDGQIVDSSANLELSYKKLSVNDQLYRTSTLSEASETQDGSGSVDIDTQKFTGHKIISDSTEDQSTTILQKLFGSASKVNLSGSSGVVEHHDTERDDTWSPNAVQSSKFAQWFFEDEKAAIENQPQPKSSDLLSLIVGGEKDGSQVSDVHATKDIPPLSFQSSKPTNTSSTIGISEQLYNSSKQEVVPAILTCEDLEQTILSEYGESSSTLQAPVQVWNFSGAKTEESKADIDNQASQHLMSLLHKGASLINNTESPTLDSGSTEKLHVSEGASVGSALYNSREDKAENIHHSGQSLTLETLFGSAFMKELQSVGAPVSVQKGSVSSARTDISEPQGLSFVGDSLFPTSTVDIRSGRSNHENNVLQSSQRKQSKSDNIENWLGFNYTQVEVDQSERGGANVAADIQLPEEESLITVGDPVNNSNSMFMSASNSTKGELLYSNKPADLAEKLATLNTVFNDERPMAVGQEGPPFVRGPYDPTEPEIPFRNILAQPSSPQFQPPQMNHGRPFLRPLDSYPAHVGSRTGPEGMLDHDAPANHRFPSNMMRPPFHHPNTGPAGFDLPHHSMLQQMQMQMPAGNLPPLHLRQEFPRGGLLPPHSGNHATGFTQAPNQMQGLPFGHQQPNFGGLGMRLQAPDAGNGSNHPDSFQRLLEMEMRANARKIHPSAAVGRTQGMFGHDLDMGFRYR